MRWIFPPSLSRDELPARPVALGAAVLDREDRVVLHEPLVERDDLGGGELLALERVRALLEELRRGAVEREEDVPAGLVAGLADRVDDEVERRARGLEVRREAALVADARREALRLEEALERVEDLRAGAQRLAEAPKPAGTSMNSWMSRGLSACAPPFTTFIIGTGSVTAPVPPR